MLVPAIFDIVSSPSAEEPSDEHPLRPDLVIFGHDQILLLRRPWSLLMRVDKVIVVSMPALAWVAPGHELANGSPIVIAELEDESPEAVVFFARELAAPGQGASVTARFHETRE